MAVFTFKDNAVVFTVKAAPGARKNLVKKPVQTDAGDWHIPVMVTTAPEKGKATKALIALLAKEWKLPKSAFQVISGETSRQKGIKLNGVTKEVYDLLVNWATYE